MKFMIFFSTKCIYNEAPNRLPLIELCQLWSQWRDRLGESSFRMLVIIPNCQVSRGPNLIPQEQLANVASVSSALSFTLFLLHCAVCIMLSPSRRPASM